MHAAVTRSGPLARPARPPGAPTQRPTWVHHPTGTELRSGHPVQPAAHVGRTDTEPTYYFEPQTTPLHIERPAPRATTTPRGERRIDPPVVIAAIVMLALAVGVLVGLATL
ncbi:hypothetical protein VZC37_23350 [Gordonia sp. LSe1-13]|uniref:Uncharacterized protein n=1 Tax=Gordonia sesuvii TaxID=3116777 RepID=A0ABU7MJJ8_9ACTN|nr:hypothetical protein [Gordonia sp. LSe1-13]